MNRVKHTQKLVVEHRAKYVRKDTAIGHFPHIKTRSHLNSEVNVWRGPLVLALETDREYETANRFSVWSAFLEQNLEKVRRGYFFGTKFGEGAPRYFFGTKFGEGAPRVLFWNKIWRRCAEGTFLEQNLEKVRRGYFFGTKFGEGAPRVLFWNKIWRRCAEGTFLEQNLEKGRGVKMLYYISSISISGERVFR